MLSFVRGEPVLPRGTPVRTVQQGIRDAMATKTQAKRKYPWTEKLGNHEFTFRLLTPADREHLLRFTRSLPEDDVMFLRKDITQDVVVDDWLDKVKKGATITVLAENDDGKIVGYASLHLDQLLWTRHLGEIRVVLAPKFRGIGLGKRLLNEMFLVGKQHNLQRIVVNMRRQQPRLQGMLERMGFRAEALLTDWLMDAVGRTHDLLVMSCRLDEI